MSLLGLEKLTPKGRLQITNALFSTREMREIIAARRTGVSWQQIWQKVKRYPTMPGLRSAVHKWAKDHKVAMTPKRRAPRAKKSAAVKLTARKARVKKVRRRHGRGFRKVKVVDAARIVNEREKARTPLAASA